jgi:hypothetical protein
VVGSCAVTRSAIGAHAHRDTDHAPTVILRWRGRTVLTPSRENVSLSRAYELGANSSIVKPVDAGCLVERDAAGAPVRSAGVTIAVIALSRDAATRPRRFSMYATMRQYAGITHAAFDTLMSRRADVEKLIRKTPGFLPYDLVRTPEGMTSVTVCTDQAGTDESNRQVAEWNTKNPPALVSAKPTITAGEDVIHFAAS